MAEGIKISPPPLPVALQSLKDLGLLTYRRFLELFRHTVGLLTRVISPSQGLYLHRTTQHRETQANIHALNGIRTHDPSNQPAMTHASDRTATVTGIKILRDTKHRPQCGLRLTFDTFNMANIYQTNKLDQRFLTCGPRTL
jgi:hypothetical protein